MLQFVPLSACYLALAVLPAVALAEDDGVEAGAAVGVFAADAGAGLQAVVARAAAQDVLVVAADEQVIARAAD